jgi:hypothetical protein
MSPQAAAIALYRRVGSNEPSAYFGKLVFGPITFNQSRSAGLLLSFDYQPADGTDQDRWLRLDFRIGSQQTAAPRRYGTAEVSWPGSRLLPAQAETVEVGWVLLPEDVERIELDHGAPSGSGSPWTFHVTVEGMLAGSAGVIAIDGEGTLTIPASDWEALAHQMGYGLGPTARTGLGQARLDHPSWREAEKRLAPARDHLREGEGRAALEVCLRQFEALAGKSYTEDAWKGLWEAPSQKEGGLAAALAGHCSYLNRIGHHLDDVVDPAAGERLEMPLDQWEAELAVAISHLYLAYVLRLNTVAAAPSKPTT